MVAVSGLLLPFEIYRNDEGWLLAVSGSGPFRACTATAALLANCPTGSHGFVLANFGIAGAEPESWEMGQGLLINRVQDESSGRRYYPERSIRSSWKEAPLVTVGQPASGRKDRTPPPLSPPLYDMEGYGVCAAAESFVSNSQVILGKVVSDYVDAENLPDWKVLASRLEALYRARVQEFLDILRSQHAFLSSEPRVRRAREAAEWAERFAEPAVHKLSLTVNQTRQLSATLQAFALANSPAQREAARKSANELLESYDGKDKRSRARALERLLSLLQTF